MKITAAAYMRINVTYACLNETTFSVGSIAKEYLTNENTKNPLKAKIKSTISALD